MSTFTHELKIVCSVPTSGDAMEQAELIGKAQAAITALKEFAQANGGAVSIKVGRKLERDAARPTPAPTPIAQAAE